MSLRFLADADLNFKIVLGLRRKEPAIDFLDAKSAGLLGLPDPHVLRLAADLKRILVSHDRKTMPAHFMHFIENNWSPGLIILPQDLEIGPAIDDLLITWAGSDESDLRNSILYLPL
jgi:hypothetical protein